MSHPCGRVVCKLCEILTELFVSPERLFRNWRIWRET